jgi:hypothetical protein
VVNLVCAAAYVLDANLVKSSSLCFHNYYVSSCIKLLLARFCH